jgi:hypothetical protein
MIEFRHIKARTASSGDSRLLIPQLGFRNGQGEPIPAFFLGSELFTPCFSQRVELGPAAGLWRPPLGTDPAALPGSGRPPGRESLARRFSLIPTKLYHLELRQ